MMPHMTMNKCETVYEQQWDDIKLIINKVPWRSTWLDENQYNFMNYGNVADVIYLQSVTKCLIGYNCAHFKPLLGQFLPKKCSTARTLAFIL